MTQGTPLAVMASGSAEPGLDHVGAAFTAATGRPVAITYNAEIAQPDVIVASEDAIARRFAPSGRIAGTGAPIGRVGIAAGVRKGRAVPDIGSIARLRRALLDSEAILLTENHSSGLYMERVIARLGLTRSLGPRIRRHRNGPETVLALLAAAGDEIAFLSVNEFLVFADRGAVVAGPLPEGLQRLRTFLAVPAAGARDPGGAAAFVRFCGDAGRPILRGFGFA